MEALEKSFVRTNDCITIETNTTEPNSIKTCSFSDCFVDRQSIEPMSTFIPPGIIIDQESKSIIGRATDGTIMFKHSAEHRLRHIVMEGPYLFALDGIGTAHIYSPGEAEPQLYELGRRPVGWKPIPRTKTFIYWTSLSLHVYDPETDEHKNIRGHHARITAADATVDVAVTGDSIGYICIWYISSWQCHHIICTGHVEILNICIQGKKCYVLTANALKEYDLQLGVENNSKTIKASSMVSLMDHLLISDEHHIALFQGITPKMCIKQKHRKIVSAEESLRFFTLTNKGIVESEWPRTEWPSEIISWIQTPTLPFAMVWPKKTYMDVLAITADIWIPKLKNMDLPKHWFRNETLREAIWDSVIENDIDISYNWLFLTPHIMKQWYQKNLRHMLLLTEDNNYNPSAFHILNRVYKHINIESLKIQKWCWDHHEKIALKPINMHILQQDDAKNIMDYISKKPVTAGAATLLTPHSVKIGLRNGFVAIYIRMLKKYHKCLPSGPTHHMKKIFNMVVSHIYSALDAETISTPLKESGKWVLMERPNPGLLGAYIQQRNLNGFISKIEFHPQLKIHWVPVTSAISLIISNDEPIHIWKYHHKDGPNTIIECALSILTKDLWQTNMRINKFLWPISELEAFECEGISIRVFGESMRITNVQINSEITQLKTSSGLMINQEESMDISTVAPLWSYFEDHLYHIIPMKLKICSEITKTIGKRSKVSVMYAKELISSIQYKTIQHEHKHRAPHRITAMAGQIGSFFLGLVTGEILEYESVANFVPVRHFVKHTTPIVSLTIMDTRLISLCDEEMNVWCLHSGCLIFGKMTEIMFVSCIPNDERSIYIVKKDDDCAEITLWDIFEEVVLKNITIETKGTILTTKTPAIITEQKVIPLKNQYQQYEIEIDKGEITCVTETFNGICGGTDIGTVFMVNELEEEVHCWNTTNRASITAIQAMDNQPYVITGTDRGEVMIWKIDEAETDIVSISRITTCQIDAIYFDNMFAAIIRGQTVFLYTIVHDRCILAANTISKIMRWSEQWKRRLVKETQNLIQPCVETCIIQTSGLPDAFELLLQCTEDYADRLKWCNRDFVDILLESPTHYSKLVIKRLASFSGPKLDCAICNDEQRSDKIVYLKTCQHRFHAGCIAELIRKVPEYHHEMQQEYALHVTLKCPICREPFAESDVENDRFLNQNFFHD